MRRRAMWIAMMSLAAALIASAAMAGAAGAAPVWKLGGTTLSGSETVVAESSSVSYGIPGLTSICQESMTMSISNSGSKGIASVESVSYSGCHTGGGVCTITAASPHKLPWAGTSELISESPYVVIEGTETWIKYGGESCAADETTLPYKGAIGGLFDNAGSKLVFNAASFKATGAEFKSVGTTPTTYEAEFNVRATGSHAGEAVTLS